MRILLVACFVLSASIVAAKNDKNGNNGNGKNKIKRPGKLLGANDVGSGTNTCYVRCDYPCSEEGCEVFDGAGTSLGSFDCKCGDCAPGETGVGSYKCSISGIRDLNADDTSASCGGGGFDLNLLLGRNDCVKNGPDVICPETCQCESCECDPCGDQEQCVPRNGKFGGFQCKSVK